MKSLILGLIWWKSFNSQLWLVLLATFRARLDPRFLFSKSEKVLGLGLWDERNLLAQREQHFRSDWRGHKIVQMNFTWIMKHRQQVQQIKIRMHNAMIPKGPNFIETFDSWSIFLPSEINLSQTQKTESGFWNPTSRRRFQSPLLVFGRPKGFRFSLLWKRGDQATRSGRAGLNSVYPQQWEDQFDISIVLLNSRGRRSKASSGGEQQLGE